MGKIDNEVMNIPDSETNSSVSDERIAELHPLVKKFGLDPSQINWTRLNRAFIHRSYRAENTIEEDNERLEFLGDSVIGLICTEHILRQSPESDEGTLSKLRASLVSRASLGRIAMNLGLGELMLLGAGEARNGGRERPSILGSALEAICGAFYLDIPWKELGISITNTIIIPAMEASREDQLIDYKSKLQEWAQKEFQKVPEYTVVSAEGPDHLKEFAVEVSVENRKLGTGRGPRKKVAENEAAHDALVQMGHEI